MLTSRAALRLLGAVFTAATLAACGTSSPTGPGTSPALRRGADDPAPRHEPQPNDPRREPEPGDQRHGRGGDDPQPHGSIAPTIGAQRGADDPLPRQEPQPNDQRHGRGNDDAKRHA